MFNNSLNNKNDKKSSDALNKYAITQMRWLFTILGIWFLISKNTTKSDKYLALIILIFNQALLAFVLIPSFCHIFYYERDIKIKMALFGPIGVVLSCALKYFAVIYRRHSIEICIEQIKMDWKEINCHTDKEIMIKNVKNGISITIFFATFMYIGGVSHQTFAPFLPGTIISLMRNSTNRPLIYPVYDMLFDSQKTPVYELIYLSHILTGIIVCTMAVGTCNLGAIFITHACGIIQLIILRIENLIDDDTDNNEKHKKINSRIKEIINLHNKVLKLVE